MLATMPEIKTFKTSELQPAPYNPREITEPALVGLSESLKKFGYLQPVIVNVHNENQPTVVGGHQRLKALEMQGYDEIQCIAVDYEALIEKAANVSLNNQEIAGTFIADLLQPLLEELSFELDEFEDLMLDDLAEEFDFDLNPDNFDPGNSVERSSLFDKFLVPPFSVLDARQGYWQERKKQWLSLGIQSELGRGGIWYFPRKS